MEANSVWMVSDRRQWARAAWRHKNPLKIDGGDVIRVRLDDIDRPASFGSQALRNNSVENGSATVSVASSRRPADWLRRKIWIHLSVIYHKRKMSSAGRRRRRSRRPRSPISTASLRLSPFDLINRDRGIARYCALLHPWFSRQFRALFGLVPKHYLAWWELPVMYGQRNLTSSARASYCIRFRRTSNNLGQSRRGGRWRRRKRCR